MEGGHDDAPLIWALALQAAQCEDYLQHHWQPGPNLRPMGDALLGGRDLLLAWLPRLVFGERGLGGCFCAALVGEGRAVGLLSTSSCNDC